MNMNHEDLKILISAYLDGEVTPEEKDLVENHLASCESCQKDYVEFQKVSSSLKRWPKERLSPDVQLDIKGRLAQTKEKNMNKRELSIQWASVASVVMVMAVSAFGMYYYGQVQLAKGFDARERLIAYKNAALSSTAPRYEVYHGPANYTVPSPVEESSSEDLKKSADIGDLALLKTRGGGETVTTELLGSEAGGKDSSSISKQVFSGEFAKAQKGDEAVAQNRLRDGSNGAGYGMLSAAAPMILAEKKNFADVYDSRESEPAKAKAVDKLAMIGSVSSNEGTAGYGYGQVVSSLSISGDRRAKEELARGDVMAGAIGGNFRQSEMDSNMPVQTRGVASPAYYPEQEQMIYPPRPYPPVAKVYNYPVEPSDSESYDRIYETGFRNALQEPHSTFSIDVDTASYSNVRRFLNQGQMPPADAVRIEEMINYFTYDYPEPAWGQPFSVNAEVAPCPWNPSHRLALVGIQGKRLNKMTMPPSNLVFLIDVSGSMNDANKLPLLQQAFRMMTEQLESKDKVSIVVYAGAAGLVLDATPGNYKQQIIDAIDRLRAGGSTAGGAGIQLAYQMARANFIKGGNNRVILATDGDFNVGVANDDELTRMIEDYRNQGVYLTVLGFGIGNYKDSKMEKLADKGNGNYFYIDTTQEARKVLVNELGSNLFTIAKDVKIQVEFNPATVQSYRLVGYENRMLNKEDFRDDTKDAGELGAGHTVTALYEIIPSGEYRFETGGAEPLIYQREAPKVSRPMFQSSDLMTVQLRYKEPDANVSKLIRKAVGRGEMKNQSRSDNMMFASAVAEFGLLLRNSSYRGVATFDHVISTARAAKPDQFGYRAEFVDLVERAKALSPYQPPVPYIQDEPPSVWQANPEPAYGKGQK